ncbi:MAG: hypothetical protein M1823_002604 [Watsoniomyces obsoletus]|nr:MAG: hypothetical protein M1823_002604 [Watsoniomyces obsoletus]
MSTGIQPQGVFDSTSVPNIDPRSHILGLVGTHDYENRASPTKDGWFLSDFYLFHHLLAGLCQSQAWFTCLDPGDLVQKYGEYAHGNPWQDRRIVLDADLLQQEDRSPRDALVITEAHELLEKFLTHFRDVCRRAHAAGDPILLLIFGHGDGDTYGIDIGLTAPKKYPQLSMDTVQEALQRHPGLAISMLLTSCYSGGWTTHLNMTAMTAAGEDEPSESWPESYSLGRASGSIYATAVVERLKEDSRILLPASLSSDQPTDASVAYRDFTEGVKAKLLLLDRFGDDHNIQFTAQDDDWMMEYHQRTGIPNAIFHERWSSLRAIPSTDRTLHPHGDRSSDEFLRQQHPDIELATVGAAATGLSASYPRASFRGRHGGSAESIEAIMFNRAQRYLNSFPGRNSLAPNIIPHGLARQAIEGRCNLQELVELSAILAYRDRAMNVARTLLAVLGVKEFQSHWTWDPDSWMHDPSTRQRLDRRPTVVRQLLDAKLIPQPGLDEGRLWLKPIHYLAAALFASDVPDHDIPRRIERAKQWRDEQVKLSTKRYLGSVKLEKTNSSQRTIELKLS